MEKHVKVTMTYTFPNSNYLKKPELDHYNDNMIHVLSMPT